MGDSVRGHVVFGTKTRPRRQRNYVYTVGIFNTYHHRPEGPAGRASLRKNHKHRCREAHEVRDVPHCLASKSNLPDCQETFSIFEIVVLSSDRKKIGVNYTVHLRGKMIFTTKIQRHYYIRERERVSEGQRSDSKKLSLPLLIKFLKTDLKVCS